MVKKILFILLVFSGAFISLAAQPPVQDKAQLEKERQEIQREMNELQSLSLKIKGQKNQTMAQYNVLNRKLNLQERYLNNINKEIRNIDDDIYRGNIEVYRLQKQLDTLKVEYAHTVIYAYKNRSTYDYVNFIFSASSFNDAIKRIAYLKSYRKYREKQVKNIIETQNLIGKRKKQQLEKKVQKNIALENQTKQIAELAKQRKEKDDIITSLKSQEKDIQKQMTAKKKRDNELKNSIAAVVNRELDIARKKAEDEFKKNATITTSPVTNPASSNATTTIKTTSSGSYLDLNPTDVRLNGAFELNRGKLPWPVDNGYVCIHFGSYMIEGTKLKGDNPGITICTPQAGISVKSIFTGEVVSVFNTSDEMGVMIRHGKYFTTYSNLSSVTVRRGDQANTGQSIAKLGADDEGGGGRLDFLLMIEKKNVNPESWLKR